ncbi:hypothetical protein [Faecalibaculum rodentium]|uniref:hypothetical protein n=1 Tax=Faecalibaculum rodentium TaxID=1702221 RepID=UPI0023F21539|nr:hypothetical protein [Faecalibaculum rodentium]
MHGTNVLGAVIDGTYLTALTMNDSLFQAGKPMEYIWTRASFDSYVWMGGAGCSLALVIAVLVFSKRADSRAVCKCPHQWPCSTSTSRWSSACPLC